MSPSKRRKVIENLCHKLKVSERRACKVIRQNRATQRKAIRVSSEEELLTARIIELATKYGRYGYRRITAMLKRESWMVNHKRVERIWRKRRA